MGVAQYKKNEKGKIIDVILESGIHVNRFIPLKTLKGGIVPEIWASPVNTLSHEGSTSSCIGRALIQCASIRDLGVRKIPMSASSF